MDEIPIYSSSTHEQNQYNLGDIIKLEYTSSKIEYYVCDEVRLYKYNFQAHFKQISQEEALKLWREKNNFYSINIF